MRLGGSYGDRDRGMLDLKSVDMRFMYLMELSGKDIYVCDKKCKRLSNAYNSGCVSIYEAKAKTLRYSVYRDGCFYPYYGKLEVAE